MSDRVYAIVSVYDAPELVPHFLHHYTQLGVQRIFVAVRAKPDTDLAMKVLAYAKGYPATVHCVPMKNFTDVDKAAVEASILNQHGVGPDDYVMHLDLDEFQEYPAPLSEIVRLMNQRGNWAISGWLFDRVSMDGRLPAITSIPSIGEQFPIGCKITEHLLKACIQKIMLCRNRVRLREGRHRAINAKCDAVPIGDPRSYLVHHFKWIRGIDARLRERMRSGNVCNAYVNECCRFLNHFDTFGRIDLSDPAFEARQVSGTISDAQPRVTNVHYIRTANVGDLSCAPAQYFPLNATRRDTHWHPHANDLLIIGGGGLLSPWFYPALDRYMDAKPIKLVIWGVGTQLRRRAVLKYPKWFSRCNLIGIRDWVKGYRWVPCVSCMSPLFDRHFPVRHPIVVFKHAERHNLPEVEAPLMCNHNVSMTEAIEFLASAELVITNSYHGMYWSTLLGKRVIVYPFNAKHGLAKHKHVMLEAGANWKDAVPHAVSYPEALAECRQANIDFFEDVQLTLAKG